MLAIQLIHRVSQVQPRLIPLLLSIHWSTESLRCRLLSFSFINPLIHLVPQERALSFSVTNHIDPSSIVYQGNYQGLRLMKETKSKTSRDTNPLHVNSMFGHVCVIFLTLLMMFRSLCSHFYALLTVAWAIISVNFGWLSLSHTSIIRGIYSFYATLAYIRHFIFAGCYDNNPWYL